MKTEDRLKEREVTVEYLEKAFDHYNHLCFGGLLPRPRLRLSRAKSRLGWMRYKVDANGESLIPYDFTIGITTAYRLNTEQIDDVLIHEMIHYHIAYHQLRDNAPHGRRFRQIMETINHDYQRHIRISVRHTNLPTRDGDDSRPAHNGPAQSRPNRLPPYVVLAIQTKDGHYYLSSVAARSSKTTYHRRPPETFPRGKMVRQSRFRPLPLSPGEDTPRRARLAAGIRANHHTSHPAIGWFCSFSFLAVFTISVVGRYCRFLVV